MKKLISYPTAFYLELGPNFYILLALTYQTIASFKCGSELTYLPSWVVLVIFLFQCLAVIYRLIRFRKNWLIIDYFCQYTSEVLALFTTIYCIVLWRGSPAGFYENGLIDERSLQSNACFYERKVLFLALAAQFLLFYLNYIIGEINMSKLVVEVSVRVLCVLKIIVYFVAAAIFSVYVYSKIILGENGRNFQFIRTSSINEILNMFQDSGYIEILIVVTFISLFMTFLGSVDKTSIERLIRKRRVDLLAHLLGRFYATDGPDSRKLNGFVMPKGLLAIGQNLKIAERNMPDFRKFIITSCPTLSNYAKLDQLSKGEVQAAIDSRNYRILEKSKVRYMLDEFDLGDGNDLVQLIKIFQNYDLKLLLRKIDVDKEVWKILRTDSSREGIEKYLESSEIKLEVLKLFESDEKVHCDYSMIFRKNMGSLVKIFVFKNFLKYFNKRGTQSLMKYKS